MCHFFGLRVFFFSFSSALSDLPLWCWGERAGKETNEGDSQIPSQATAALEGGTNPHGDGEGAAGSAGGSVLGRQPCPGSGFLGGFVKILIRRRTPTFPRSLSRGVFHPRRGSSFSRSPGILARVLCRRTPACHGSGSPARAPPSPATHPAPARLRPAASAGGGAKKNPHAGASGQKSSEIA